MDKTTAPSLPHLTCQEDLVTSEEQTRAAFIGVLVERGDMAIPVIEQAKALRVAVATHASPQELLERYDIRSALLCAAGIPDKDARRLSEEDRSIAIQTLVEEYLLPKGKYYADELVFRFLLAKGAAMVKPSQKMLGLMANRRFARGVAASLLLRGVRMLVRVNVSAVWQTWDAATHDIPLGVRGVAWSGADGPRTLLFGHRVPLCGRIFDMVIKRFRGEQLEATNGGSHPEHYLGMGEVESELNESSARTRWRSSERAFEQAKQKFSQTSSEPKMFFIGTSIEEDTAQSLWRAVHTGLLANVANSHSDAQLGAVCRWAIQL